MCRVCLAAGTLNPIDRVVLADPANAAAAWACGGGVGLQRTEDGNGTWQRLSYEFHDLVAVSSQVLYGVRTWVTGQSSVEWSLDGGNNWINIGDSGMGGLSSAPQPLSVVSP
jgi:photosystem II stability/assembly factor-like uncharacterized protein